MHSVLIIPLVEARVSASKSGPNNDAGSAELEDKSEYLPCNLQLRTNETAYG